MADDKKLFSARIDRSVFDMVEKYAHRRRISRSAAVDELLTYTLDSDRLGDHVNLVRRAIEAVILQK